VVGVPVKAPVEVSKLMPAGAEGEIEYVATAPPVEETVKPVAAVLTVRFSELDESVKAGAATTTVNVKILVNDPVALVAVTV
jgi:hypothetical protein